MHEPLQSERKKAFTLIEVIIAMVIFGMVIVGGILGVQKGFELVEGSRHYTRSSQVLQSELELLRTLPWATFSTLDDATLTSRFNEQIEDQFGAGTYSGTVETRRVPAGSEKMEVKVSVEWKNRAGRMLTASYITYFTNGGLNDYYIN